MLFFLIKYFRDVDDFALWDTDDNIQDNVVDTNDLVPSIEFTVEEDVSLILNEGNFNFKVFGKPT